MSSAIPQSPRAKPPVATRGPNERSVPSAKNVVVRKIPPATIGARGVVPTPSDQSITAARLFRSVIAFRSKPYPAPPANHDVTSARAAPAAKKRHAPATAPATERTTDELADRLR